MSIEKFTKRQFEEMGCYENNEASLIEPIYLDSNVVEFVRRGFRKMFQASN